ncbi:MAG: ABC-F family ATP-binding cassette domain-containing protein [Desulforhopalus sp.]|jgi:ATP-binding cassette subfamily F protein 3|nr:ABC-F family ATP-binding cassette domain-containing protein [Desulforhopalus sp.]
MHEKALAGLSRPWYHFCFSPANTMIQLSNISLQHGERTLLRNASLQLPPGSRTGLVGPNGSGKTTLFRLITGEEIPDSGETSLPKQTVIGYFSQDVGEMCGRSVLAETMSAAGQIVKLGEEIEAMALAMAEPMDDTAMAELLNRYGEAVELFEQRGGYDLEPRAQAVLTGLGIDPARFDLPVENFSGGWKMRIALAKILTINPDFLLLDEPTNHLDLESILWLEEWLRSEYTGGLLMTCHDREFMNRVVKRIIEVADGATTTYSGDFDFYLVEREVRRRQLLASHRRQQEMLAKEEEFIARFAARASHAAQVQSRVKKLEKIERIVVPPEQSTINFSFPVPPRGGEDVLQLSNLGKTWTGHDGQKVPVFSGLNVTLRRLEKIAVAGVNGAGKSTLLKIIAGQTAPSEGEMRIGTGISCGYFSQHAMDLLSPEQTVFSAVQEVLPQENIGVIRNLCAAFLFRGDDVDKRVANLSGGEKSRVVLARLLGQNHNFLILDEPTNHLDIQSREVLLAALQKFAGTILVVSHDRHFLRSLVTRVLFLEDGVIHLHPGGYDSYLRSCRKEPLVPPR